MAYYAPGNFIGRCAHLGVAFSPGIFSLFPTFCCPVATDKAIRLANSVSVYQPTTHRYKPLVHVSHKHVMRCLYDSTHCTSLDIGDAALYLRADTTKYYHASNQRTYGKSCFVTEHTCLMNPNKSRGFAVRFYCSGTLVVDEVCGFVHGILC